MKVVYSEDYLADIGMHVFPTQKYKHILEALRTMGIVKDNEIMEPPMATREELLHVHTSEYVTKLENFTLSIPEIIQMELPYSPEVKLASFKAAGGTILATQIAVEENLGINIGGGFHHAFPDHGEGFCVLNDVAIALQNALDKKWIFRPCIVDLDLHQGNGNAYFFRNDKRVFTFSMHQLNNYPMIKPPGSIDVDLSDETADEEYHMLLKTNLDKIYDTHKPDICYYIAGADPYEDDLLGGLAITKEGLAERDRMVLEKAASHDTKMVIVLGGGYARNFQDTVEIHTTTIALAAKIFGKWKINE